MTRPLAGRPDPGSTDARCRNHPHHCPGCGVEIECGYICCATCTPPGVAAYAKLMESAQRAVGPGSPATVLAWLYEELERRFPDPSPLAAEPPAGRYLAALDVAVEQAEAHGYARGVAAGIERALRAAWNDEHVGCDTTEDDYVRRHLRALRPAPTPEGV